MFGFWKKNTVISEPLTEREKLIEDKICQSMVNNPDKWCVDKYISRHECKINASNLISPTCFM